MKAYTDYPFKELGDKPFEEAPVRAVEVLWYDLNKRCAIRICERGQTFETVIKRGYLYREPGRCGDVRTIDVYRTRTPNGRHVWQVEPRRYKRRSYSIWLADDTYVGTFRTASVVRAWVHKANAKDPEIRGTIYTNMVHETRSSYRGDSNINPFDFGPAPKIVPLTRVRGRSKVKRKGVWS